MLIKNRSHCYLCDQSSADMNLDCFSVWASIRKLNLIYSKPEFESKESQVIDIQKSDQATVLHIDL